MTLYLHQGLTGIGLRSSPQMENHLEAMWLRRPSTNYSADWHHWSGHRNYCFRIGTSRFFMKRMFTLKCWYDMFTFICTICSLLYALNKKLKNIRIFKCPRLLAFTNIFSSLVSVNDSLKRPSLMRSSEGYCACPVLWTTIWSKVSEAFEMDYMQPFGSMKAKKPGKTYGDR